MLDEEIQFPGELGFVKGQTARDRLLLEGRAGGVLNFGNQLNRSILKLITLFPGSVLEDTKQLPVTKILLDNHTTLAINRIDLRNR